MRQHHIGRFAVGFFGCLRAAGIALCALIVVAPALAQEGASENAPLSLVRRAAEMRAAGYADSRRQAEAWIVKAETGACGPAARSRAGRLREILESAEVLAQRAAGWLNTQAGKAASAYSQADKLARSVVSAAENWSCEGAP